MSKLNKFIPNYRGITQTRLPLEKKGLASLGRLGIKLLGFRVCSLEENNPAGLIFIGLYKVCPSAAREKRTRFSQDPVLLPLTRVYPKSYLR